MKRIVIYSIIGVLITLSLAGCSKEDGEVFQDEVIMNEIENIDRRKEETGDSENINDSLSEEDLVEEEIVINEEGNTQSNIKNLGIAGSQGNYIYYSTGTKEDAGLYRMTKDGKNNEKLNDCMAQNINVIGNWVYYTNYYDHEKLYRTSIKTKTTEILTSESVAYAHADRNFIYFIKVYNDYSELVKMNLDSLEEDVIGQAMKFAKHNNSIVYVENFVDKKLHIVDLEADMKKTVIDFGEYPVLLLMDDNYIYFNTLDNNSILERVDFSGGNREKLSNYSSYSTNIVKDKVYFHSNGKLISMNLDGENIEEICNFEKNSNINIINNEWFFYTEATDDVVTLSGGFSTLDTYPYYNLFMMDIDGSNVKQLPLED